MSNITRFVAIRFVTITTTTAAAAFAAIYCAPMGMMPSANAQTKAKPPVKLPVKPSSQARYTSKAGFSFAVPPKWQRDDADISMERVRYTLTTEDGRVVASMKISTLRDKDATPDALAERIRETVKENTGKILVVRDKAVTVDKAPGILIETNNTRASDPDTEITLLTTRSGVTAQVVMTCKTADHAKYAPVFDKIVETFKWQ